MNNFEIFKLKKAGLTNLQVNKVLAYREKTGKSLSLRNIAVVSETSKPTLFMEQYKALDAKACREDGILLSAIRPPTVPAGTSRIRLTVTAAHTKDELDRAAEVMKRHWR